MRLNLPNSSQSAIIFVLGDNLENLHGLERKKFPMAKTLKLKDSMSKLESLVRKLESGEIDLDESLRTFEVGIKLTRDIQDSINAAVQKVRVLTEKDGLPLTSIVPSESGE